MGDTFIHFSFSLHDAENFSLPRFRVFIMFYFFFRRLDAGGIERCEGISVSLLILLFDFIINVL